MSGKRMSSNSFAALEPDTDESGCDEVESHKKPPNSRSDLVSCEAFLAPSVSQQSKHRQAGGSVVMRIDPIVGLENDKTVDFGLSNVDVDACCKVIEVLGKNPNLFKLPAFKKLRAALHPLIMEQLKSNYQSTGSAFKDEADGNRNRKRRKRDPDVVDREARATALETEYINQTQLRAVRMQQLELLNEDGFGIQRVPDGVALLTNDSSSSTRLMLTAGATGKLTDASNSVVDDDRELRDPISCYICHKPYRKLHFFYHQLCPECAAFNYSKRDEMADMRGKVCLVTGARQKIGFRCALKLLRCGARVIATTRFPFDASKRFLAETDSPVWFERLHVYGVDFRNLVALEWFCTYIIENYDRLDAIVNNAAQTVRRPPAYYAHLVEAEKMIGYSAHSNNESKDNENELSTAYHGNGISNDINETFDDRNDSNSSSSSSSSSNNSRIRKSLNTILHHQKKFTSSLSQAVESAQSPVSLGSVADSDRSNEGTGRGEGEGGGGGREGTGGAGGGVISEIPPERTDTTPQNTVLTPAISSSEMTQIILTKGDEEISSSESGSKFPLGATDVNGQQVDLRTHNSWTMRLHEVSTPELAEVFSINAIAPAIINARLKPLMERDPDALKFIVNVSAMEGKFYRFKSANHPHTNMAKASLNMMTRTSAQDYVKSKIYMTAVDTGWINDEKPIDLAAKHHEKHNFQTPIDELDAASRVLDPIIAPLLAQQRGEIVDPPWGFFLKDYQKCEW